MTKPLLTWQLFLGFFTGLILGSTLALFLFMKNLDIAGIRKDHAYLKEQYEMLRQKEAIGNNISDYIDEAEAMTDYNEEAVIMPEEGK